VGCVSAGTSAVAGRGLLVLCCVPVWVGSAPYYAKRFLFRRFSQVGVLREKIIETIGTFGMREMLAPVQLKH